MPKVGRQQDPHMKSPWPKLLLIIAIVALLLIFVAPKIVDIYNDNLDETNERAANS